MTFEMIRNRAEQSVKRTPTAGAYFPVRLPIRYLVLYRKWLSLLFWLVSSHYISKTII